MSVSSVRLLVGDIPQRGRFETVGDGITLEFDIPEHPILSASERVYVDGVLQTETTQYTLDDALGVLVFVTAPPLDVPVLVTYSFAQFSDADMTAFLSIESGDARLAAADALDSIATNAALLSGRISMLDLTLDGPAVAKILQDTAKQYRDFATSGEAPVVTEESDAGFDVAEMVFATNAEEKMIAEQLRGG